MVVFAFLHVISLLVSAGFGAAGSEFHEFLRMPCWVFGAVSFVGVTATLLISVLLPRVKLAVPQIVQDVAVALLSVVAAVTVAGRAGVNLSGLIATSAVLTAVLGFSLQDTIANSRAASACRPTTPSRSATGFGSARSRRSSTGAW